MQVNKDKGYTYICEKVCKERGKTLVVENGVEKG